MRLLAAPFFTVVCLCPPMAMAQNSLIQDRTWESLLTEVRQLRLAVERATSLLPQTQVLLQRAQIQQQRVESLSRQLEQLRDQIARSAGENSKLAGEVKDIESRVTQEPDPSRRRDWEAGIKRAQAQLEVDAVRDQQQRARESELAGRLQNEETKLNELNDRLDALARQLESPSKK